MAAYVKLTEEASSTSGISVDDVLEYAKTGLARFKVPKYLKFTGINKKIRNISKSLITEFQRCISPFGGSIWLNFLTFKFAIEGCSRFSQKFEIFAEKIKKKYEI